MRNDPPNNFREETPGIKYGIGRGQWEHRIKGIDNEISQKDLESVELPNFVQVGSSSGIGKEEVEFITIQYAKYSFIRLEPCLKLSDIDEAIYIPFINKSLAKKITAIHIYSNGYKLQEISKHDFQIDETDFDPKLPVEFLEGELTDPWVRIRPIKASVFTIDFFEKTPIKLFIPEEVKNSLEKNK
ncbi:MAG: hypothetical protein HF307_09330 [Ignavibacteria bacterium]|nr:hypothetical protein [Ignavibacteria bacterium]